MKRNLFTGLKQGFDALMAERQGKITLRTRTVDKKPPWRTLWDKLGNSLLLEFPDLYRVPMYTNRSCLVSAVSFSADGP